MNAKVEQTNALEWALFYADQGFSVIPVAPGEKRPGVAWEEFQNRRADANQLTLWLTTMFRGCGIGFVTGAVSGNVIVVDVDCGPGKQGEETLDDLQMAYDDLPLTWISKSGGGGRHYLFRTPTGFRARTGKDVLGLHIDVPLFVVLPPSKHPTGREYQWVDGAEPGACEIADAPDWLLALVEDREGGDAESNRTTTGTRYNEAPGNTGADPFGRLLDGREQYMRDLVWAAIVELRHKSPIKPTQTDLEALHERLWGRYERHVRARGLSLDAEGRGEKELWRKIQYALKRWDTRVKRDSEKPCENRTEFKFEEPPPRPERKGEIKTFTFYQLMTDEVEEEPELIAPNFAERAGFVLIGGPPKAQKSWLKQEVLVACATGSSCLCDTFAVPNPLKVFDLQAEMNAKLLRARARSFGTFMQNKELLKTNLVVSDRFHMLLNEDGVKTAVALIKDSFPDQPPDILSFDPLANIYDQESENDNAQLMRFLTTRIEAVRQLVNPLACVFLVHHSMKRSVEDLAKDPFMAIRGAGALRGYYDSAIVIYRENEESRVRKIHFELRAGESPEPLRCELSEGRFVKVGTVDGGLPPKETCRLILREVDQAWRRGEPWSPHERAKTEGRYFVHNTIKKFEVSKEAAQNLLDGWLQNRVVVQRERVYRKHPAGLEVVGQIA